MSRCSFCARVAAAIILTMTSTVAFAQPAGERIPQLIKRGQHVVLIDDRGRELDGRIGAMTIDAFDLIVDGRPIRLEFDRVVTIDHPRDGLGNGALFGAIGLPATMWLGHLTRKHSGCAPTARCQDVPGNWKVRMTLTTAVIGGLTGLGLDALTERRDRAIYRRGPSAGMPRATIAPAVGNGVRGAVVSVTW